MVWSSLWLDTPVMRLTRHPGHAVDRGVDREVAREVAPEVAPAFAREVGGRLEAK